MLATSGHIATMRGIVGKDLDITAGRDAAHIVAINALALIRKHVATNEFTELAKIADAASELFLHIFGENTISTRLIFGVASLSLGSPVELEVIIEVKP